MIISILFASVFALVALIGLHEVKRLSSIPNTICGGYLLASGCLTSASIIVYSL